MKKYYDEKYDNQMKLLLSNHYSLVNQENIKIKLPVNNVILPRYCDRDFTPYMTTYKLHYKSYTPLHIYNVHSVSPYTLKNCPQVGVLNVQRCNTSTY